MYYVRDKYVSFYDIFNAYWAPYRLTPIVSFLLIIILCTNIGIKSQIKVLN